jgi:hypothetical protein
MTGRAVLVEALHQGIFGIKETSVSIHLENDMLSITLPVGWIDQSDSDVLAFANPSTHEELTIGLGQMKQGIDPSQLSGILWRFLQNKARALGVFASGSFTVLEAVQPTPHIPSTGTFSGLDTKNLIYSRVSVTGYIGHFVSATYHLHKCKSVSADIDARAHLVIGMCRAKATTGDSGGGALN